MNKPTDKPKQIAILVPGTGQDQADVIKEMSLPPGITVAKALDAAGLRGYELRTEQGNRMGDNDNLYSKVQDGQKLVAVPKMEVG